ncbi:MAG: putative alpha-mannosidase [Paenibacillaceae bacterium]|jgi:alpha-mannosidase|nr:putative alpha-mannosidase [Paenibacillaceae bacterium]
MALTLEWRKRVEMWKDELPRHYYTELGDMELEGFTTFDRLSAEEAMQRPFRLIAPGTPWGAKWEYGWFRGRIILPAEAAGKRIVANLEPGGESAVFLNGEPAGCVRRFEAWQRINPVHLNRITLAGHALPGQVYELLMECYAGHGIRVAHTGPTPEGRQTIPEPSGTQVETGRSTFGIWNEEVYQLWLDVETLFQLRERLDESSLRVEEIDRGLREFTLLVDFELPFPLMLESIIKARFRLEPLLQCKNGSTAPVMYAFGHSHLDICYQWPLSEARRKCARTWSTQMALMDEYPGYRFVLSQPYLYEVAKRDYPGMYERLKEKVSQGQVMPEGAMWVEADTNLPGGESLIRQFMYGLDFFYREFGMKSRLLWLPDVFGFTASLPQIMRGCGVTYFSTSKLVSDFVRGEAFPYHTFTWEGIDGSRVLAAQHQNYSAPVGPDAVMGAWSGRTPQEGVSSLLYPFGHGDGGGGPTRDHLEFLARMEDLEGAPRMRTSHPVDFFEAVEGCGELEAVYRGELYLKAHRGTLTSQAALKQGNRRCEAALHEAEFWGAWAGWAERYKYPTERMDRVWKEVLLNQFHDILPGSCIRQVAVEAGESYSQQEAAAREVSSEALGHLVAADGGKLTVFNSLSWERQALVQLPEATDSLAGSPVQELNGQRYAEITLPACGWTTVALEREAVLGGHGKDGQAEQTSAGYAAAVQGLRTSADYEGALVASAVERRLENELIAVVFNSYGEIESIVDKASGRSLNDGLCNSFRMYKDVPTVCDAWEIESMYEQQPVALLEPAVFTEAGQGPLFAVLRICRLLNCSPMTQYVILRRNSRSLEFRTEMDWQEKHKLLKVCFPVDIRADEALHDIQFGHIKRPTHRSRPHDADQFEVCQHKWTALAEPGRGAAVLNDCKYGVNVRGNSINLTLLKAALAPDMHADLGIQTFTYSVMFWEGAFMESGVIQSGYELNHPAGLIRGDGGIRSLFRLSSGQVILETVKPAGDGSGDLVVRLFEAYGSGTSCILDTDFTFNQACGCNLLEEEEEGLAGQGQRVKLEFRPFEIKTVRLARHSL